MICRKSASTSSATRPTGRRSRWPTTPLILTEFKPDKNSKFPSSELMGASRLWRPKFFAISNGQPTARPTVTRPGVYRFSAFAVTCRVIKQGRRLGTPLMKASHGIVVVGALVLVAIAITAFLITGNSLSVPGGGTQAVADKGMLVDQRPLQTARKMAALASTPEEQRIAQEVLRISDHEVDLAFADALRSATQHPAQPSPEVREINSRMNRAQAAIDAGQAQVTKLTAQLASASAREQDELQQQVELAKAQLELDQDELDDAKADLARSGGDSQNKIQRLLDEHEATEHSGDAVHPPANPPDANYLAANLVAQVRAWNALREKHQQLLEARRETLEAAARLSGSHETLEKQIQGQKPAKEDLQQQAISAGTSNHGVTSKARTAAAVSSLRQLSSAQKTMADLDKRIQDQQELSENYGNWLGLVSVRQSTSVHRLIQSGLGILLIVLLVYLAGRIIDRFFVELTPERRRLVTLRAVIRFVAQAMGVLLIAIVLFGLHT